MTKFFLNFKLPSNYIKHHLKHLCFNILNFRLIKNNLYYKNSFLNFNIDSFLVSFLLAVFFLFITKYFLFKVKYNRLPNKIQIFFELIILLILNNVKKIFGKKDKYVFALAFTVFTWIFIMNLMSLIPIDLFPFFLKKFFNINYFINVPTSDINITTSISFCVLLYIFLYKIINNGFLNILKNFFFHPFNNKFYIIFNIILEIINIFSKLLSLSLRLFGNIYSGEIIFILLSFIIPWWLQWLLILPWFLLHIFISFLQSFIFMILTIIYIS